MKPITAIVIGAGGRGRVYAHHAIENPEKLKVIGVAEPVDALRNICAEKHNISEENCFTTWEDVFKRDKFADVVMICTQDNFHFAPAMAAIEKGYDILLEKPISPSAEECIALADAAAVKGIKIAVCHILRYAPFYNALKGIIDSGEIGEIASFVQNEDVGDVHHSHSYVRGNWAVTKESSPMILAKSCHDTDIIQWLIGKKCLRISSFGSLKYFRKENCPEGTPPRCTDGCTHDCPYDARKLYLEDMSPRTRRWFRPVAAKTTDPTDEQVEAALKTGPYGRCVFQCDNDVVDHQTVNMEFEDGITVMFSMCSLTPKTGRTTKIMGTKGQISGDMEKREIIVSDFITGNERHINLEDIGGHVGHGGGDQGLMKAFCEYISGRDGGAFTSTIDVAAKNHMICFAAEEARITGKVISLDDYIEKIRNTRNLFTI